MNAPSPITTLIARLSPIRPHPPVSRHSAAARAYRSSPSGDCDHGERAAIACGEARRREAEAAIARQKEDAA